MSLLKKISRYHGLLLFFGISTLFLAIRYTSPNLTTGDDPYLHAARAYELAHGGTVSLPAISSFNSHPVDLYAGYYALLSPFTLLLDNEITRGVIGSKVFHSLLDGLIALIFFILLKEVIRKTCRLENNKIAWVAFAGTILLFSVSAEFSFRLLLERPHLTSIAILLGAAYALLAERYLLLGILAFIYPWFYSATFLLFIPVGTYVLSGLVMKKPPVSYLRPIGIVVLGLALGIALHPDSLNYLYNGYYVHLLSIYETWQSGVGGPSELGPIRHNPLLQFELWYLPFLVFAEVFFLRICFQKKSFNFTELYIYLTAGFLFITSIFIVRTSEYAIPFAVLAIIMAGAQMPLWNSLVDQFRKYAKLLPFIIVGILLALLFVNMHITISDRPAPELLPNYKGSINYINTHMKNEDRVFTQDFGMYARLAYEQLRAPTIWGMDSAFTLAEDPKAYWYIGHIVKGEDACAKKQCLPSETEDTYEVIKTYLRARYILIDSAQGAGNPYLQKFSGRVQTDNRFQKVFSDIDHLGLTIYELK